DIVATRDNCNSRLFRITITVYVDTESSVVFGGSKLSEGDLLNFGDGSPSVLVPEIGPNSTPSGPGFSSTYTVIDAARKIARATYTILHEYSGALPSYKISYREPNRNQGVLNMDQSVNTQFYLETFVNLDPFVGCSNTPNLLIPPIDRACVGSAWFHNPGAYDPDGDSLSYALVTPNQETGVNVFNYRDPDSQEFYTDFANGQEDQDGEPEFFQDPISGTITWNAPGKVGEYNIAFEIREWRKLRDGIWRQIGFVRRDMQIIVEDCDNKRPDLIIPNDTCIVAGTVLNATIFGLDPDNDKVKIEAFSEIFNFPSAQSPATYSPNPPIFRVIDPINGNLSFEWNTTCAHVKDQPYQVTFKITDQPANGGVNLATFKTWFIKVVGPAPEWKEPILDLNKRETKLEWSPYFCQNAETMQVWRRVGEFPFEPDNCQTGMPDFLGYDLIATVPSKTTNTYTDNNGGKGLAPGARYCYRLVAIFPLPRGGESYVSLDTCVGPILADVPVITNVSVDKTDLSTGEIRIRWQKPFDANIIQFPPPYHYEVYRAVGSTRGNDSTDVTSLGVFVNDTTFIDKGLNTEENFYNYSIAAYTPTNTWVGTSATASSVRLETKSQTGKIELSWSAFVPWSNIIPQYPTHELFRGNEGDAPEAFVPIASVDVTANGFSYTDEGLEDNKVYCYRVQTKGGYGNPKIITPLENFSQVICAQTGDDEPPCQLLPPLRSTLDFIDCNDFLAKDTQCDRDTYSNTIFWNKPTDAECRSDVSSYNVYAASRVGDVFTKIANVKDTFYLDSNLLSFARCYKITAVDRSGNEGEQSNELCIDNCPYYELPNVFTPNEDDFNDRFSAYSARDSENCGEANCIDISKCARFVISVKAKIYNRWGKEVYDYEGHISDEVNSIYIDWNGKDNKGNELNPAVYYYVAEVTFDTVDPAKEVKTFKGWIHLLR
nr:gliding motility-associated C-terminal domain-containing protein [Chryseolinea sp.]